MKKKWYILLILFSLFITVQVEAKTCQKIKTSTVYAYYNDDYKSVKDGTCKNMSPAGYFPLAMASVLKSYGMEYTPTEISSFLCDNYESDLEKNDYSNIKTATDFANEYGVVTETISNTMAAIDDALDNNKSVLAFINSNSEREACKKFSTEDHALAIVMKKKDSDGVNQYYVINTLIKNKGLETSSGWYKQSTIENSVIPCKGSEWISVEPDDCDEFEDGSDSSIEPGLNIPTDKEVTCKNIFKKNGSDEFNDFGQFLQDLFLGIKLLAPAMVIVLSTIDYIKAIAAENQDDVKKANQRTVKRVTAGLIIFFIPFLLDILFNLFGIYDLSTCGIGS